MRRKTYQPTTCVESGCPYLPELVCLIVDRVRFVENLERLLFDRLALERELVEFVVDPYLVVLDICARGALEFRNTVQGRFHNLADVRARQHPLRAGGGGMQLNCQVDVFEWWRERREQPEGG